MTDLEHRYAQLRELLLSQPTVKNGESGIVIATAPGEPACAMVTGCIEAALTGLILAAHQVSTDIGIDLREVVNAVLGEISSEGQTLQ